MSNDQARPASIKEAGSGPDRGEESVPELPETWTDAADVQAEGHEHDEEVGTPSSHEQASFLKRHVLKLEVAIVVATAIVILAGLVVATVLVNDATAAKESDLSSLDAEVTAVREANADLTAERNQATSPTDGARGKAKTAENEARQLEAAYGELPKPVAPGFAKNPDAYTPESLADARLDDDSIEELTESIDALNLLNKAPGKTEGLVYAVVKTQDAYDDRLDDHAGVFGDARDFRNKQELKTVVFNTYNHPSNKRATYIVAVPNNDIVIYIASAGADHESAARTALREILAAGAE